MCHDSLTRAACVMVSVITAAALGSGCGDSASDKAGGKNEAEPTMLTLANGNGDSRALEPFAAAVTRLSGGSLRVAFKNRWREGDAAFEAGVIRDVRAGKADIGWAGSRAFDDVDVSSFDALHAPLLIDSYPHERKVLESPLATEMLEGLAPLDLVGLGILPGPMRKPLGRSRLVSPDDYRGTTLAFQRSQVAEQTFRALGVRGVQIPAGAPIDGYDGIEQQISSIAGNTYDKVGAYLTANVNLWPRPAVVFMNADAFEALDDRQRSAVLAAVRTALSDTLAQEQAGDKEGMEDLCRRNVRFVTADGADMAALRRSVEPVYERLERNGRTRAAIAQIRAMGSRLAAPPDAPVCAGARSRPPALAPATIEGLYRSDITLAQLKRTPGFDSGEEHPGNVGHFGMELRKGHFRITGSSDGVDQDGTYSVKGSVLSFNWSDGGSFSYRWSVYRGNLTLKKLGEGPTFFAVHPWRRRSGSLDVGRG